MENEDTPATEPQQAPASDTPDLNSDIERLTKEAAELKDKYVRAVAEMENIRRRAEREKADLIKYSLETVFKDFLPALDSLDKALPESTDASDSFVAGLAMVKKQLLDVFKKHGLEPISAQGAPFDPNLHQAIQRIDSDQVDKETVGSEFARGYVLNGRLLRPAIVSVLTPGG
jgi:molecular chaperone GrpE